MANHPQREVVRRFVTGDITETEAKQIDLHLSVCAECRDFADEVHVQLASRQLDSWFYDGYDEAFDRAAERTVERLSSLIEDPRGAENLLAELLLDKAPERRRQIADDERFQSLKLCQLLQTQCRDVWDSDPAVALEVADLAVEVSRHLGTARYGSNIVEDVRARAWSYLGNAFRINSDLWSAEKALRQAWRHHAQAGEELFTESELLMFTASLRLDQRRCEEAIQLSDRAIAIYREGQDHQLEGAALLLKGLILDDSGRSEEAIPVLRAALSRVDIDADPRLAFAGNHNLTRCIAKSGSPEQAQRRIDRDRSFQWQPGQMDLARVLWVKGCIASSLGRFVEAVKALREVADVFLSFGLGAEVFLVSLDLGHVYALNGQYSRVKEVLGELVPLGEALGLKQEAFMAKVLYEAAQQRCSSFVPKSRWDSRR